MPLKLRPLTIVLLTGGALLILSGLSTYRWATRPAGAGPDHAQTASRRTSGGPGPAVSPRGDTRPGGLPDTAELSPGDWEAFTRFRGERQRMLGVRRRHDVVNFRAGPGTEYPVRRTVTGGMLLFPLDRINDWFRARLPDGTPGWVHRTLVRQLRVPLPVVESMREQLPPLARSVKRNVPDTFRTHNRLEVVEPRVNLRQGPGTQFGIVGHAYRYQELRMLARRGNWYRIETLHGGSGWVFRTLVEPIWLTAPGQRRRVRLSGASPRIGPRHQFQRPETVSPERPVAVLEEQGEWLMVRIGPDRIGWVHRRELSPGNRPPTDEPSGPSRPSDSPPREAPRDETRTETTSRSTSP